MTQEKAKPEKAQRKAGRTVKKSTAWKFAMGALVGFFIFDRLTTKSDQVAIAIVYALAGSTGLYQAAQVGDAWQKSANYRPELDENTSSYEKG